MAVTTKLSADEFELVCHEYGHCELVRGEVVQLSPGGMGHSRLTVRISYLIEKWALETGQGRALSGEAGIVVETDPDTVRGADVAYYSYARLPRGGSDAGFLRVAPDLAVEIIGKGQSWRSLVKKAGEYLEMGVDVVWIVDPRTKRVHVLRGNTEPSVFTGADVLVDPRTLPNFSCTVNDLFEE